MIEVQYNHPHIKIITKEIPKFVKLPLKVSILSYVSKKEVWSCKLESNSWASYSNDSIFDVKIIDDSNHELLYREYNVLEDGDELDKIFYFFCKKIKNPKGVVVGTHDGEFGEWVSAVLDELTDAKLVEASNSQFLSLIDNYRFKKNVKFINTLVSTNGEDIEFFEGGRGYTNSVKQKVIKNWERETISSKVYRSTSINNILDKKYDWLHLDIEGYDGEIIKAINPKLLPDFILFEHNNLSKKDKLDLEDYLIKLGYSLNKNDNVSYIAIK